MKKKEISQKEWDEAMEKAEQELDEIYKKYPDLKYYNPVDYLSIEQRKQWTEQQIKKLREMGQKNSIKVPVAHFKSKGGDV
jgi:hypothetical protein